MNSELYETPRDYARSMADRLREAYAIDYSALDSSNIKRGLRNEDGTGVIVGMSRIGSVQGYCVEDGLRVPQEGRLTYRGIDVSDIIAAHRQANTFGYEEVCYLLLCGKLPNAREMELFLQTLSGAKQLPGSFFQNEIFKTPCRSIMNILARSVLALYSYDDNPDDTSLDNVFIQSIELIARFPTIIANAYSMKRHCFDGESLYIHNTMEDLSLAQNFLRLIRQDKSYTDKEAKLLDALLILHAEHSGGNNSTFTCRSVTSTGSDTYSAVSAAISSLKGPLHGGANSAVMRQIRDIQANVGDIHDDEEVGRYLDRILSGEAGDGAGKLYGLGHAVYTLSDPRAVLLKRFICDTAGESGWTDEFVIADKIERLGVPKLMASKHMTIPISANVDLYSGIVYSMLGIPEDLYTPLFAMARISGWCAHRLEELVTGGRIMRPAYRSAVKHTRYIPLEERR